jgi:hypothetical protein
MSRRLQHLAVLTATASLVVTMASPLAHAATGAAAVVVTPTQAKAIVQAYEKANNKANATFDTALQDKHEEGAAKAVDDAVFRVAKKVGVLPFPAVTAVGVKVLVPRQTAYPAIFVAFLHPKEAGQSTAKFTDALVFKRDSASSPWRVADGTAFPAAAPAFTVDKDGYIPALTTSALSVTPAQVYPSWIKAQNVAGRGGTASATWAQNSLFKRFVALPAAATVDNRLTASSAHFAPLCVASVTGALCFVSTAIVDDVGLTKAERAAGDGYKVSTVDDQASLGGVAPGVYVALHVVGQRSVAIIVPRRGGKGGVALVGYVSQATAGRGTLA